MFLASQQCAVHFNSNESKLGLGFVVLLVIIVIEVGPHVISDLVYLTWPLIFSLCAITRKTCGFPPLIVAYTVFIFLLVK